MRRPAPDPAAQGAAPQDVGKQPAAKPYGQERGDRAGIHTVAVIAQRTNISTVFLALPVIHREALTPFYLEDMPMAEMTLALGPGPGTGLSRRSRAYDAVWRKGQPAAG